MLCDPLLRDLVTPRQLRGGRVLRALWDGRHVVAGSQLVGERLRERGYVVGMESGGVLHERTVGPSHPPDRRFSSDSDEIVRSRRSWVYLCGQLRLSCPWKPHTLHCPAFGETSHDRLSCPCLPHQEQVRVPVELNAVLRGIRGRPFLRGSLEAMCPAVDTRWLNAARRPLQQGGGPPLPPPDPSRE